MALLWFDGFENYESRYDMQVVTSEHISQIVANADIGSTQGRRGGRALHLGNFENWQLVFNDTYTTIIYGYAFFTNDITSHTGQILHRIYDGTTTQVYFAWVGTELAVYNGDAVLLGTTSGANLIGNVYRYIEIKVTIDGSSGVVVVRVDGIERLNVTGADTQKSANAYLTSLYWTYIIGSYQIYMDDMYILDTTGSKNNNFLSDVRVDCLRPDGAGTYTDFTPSAGSNYENVDETYPDDDTTYNESSTVGHKDSYNLGSLPDPPSGAEIFGIKSQVTIRKTDAGGARAKILTKAGTTEDLGDKIVLSDSFTTHTKLYEDNPDDAAAWEDADVNAMEVGVVIVAVTTTTTT